jgi:hypothetical protein
VLLCRTGCYAGHSGSILQLLVLGDQLLSLGKDGQLLVWKIGEYDAPQVRRGGGAAVYCSKGLYCGSKGVLLMQGCEACVLLPKLHGQLQRRGGGGFMWS